jgi:hypothetical protein
LWRDFLLALGIPEIGTVDIDGMAEVAQAAQQGLDHMGVAQEIGPFVVRKIGCDDRGTMPVPFFHELEKDVALLGFQIQISELVNCQNIKPHETVEQLS